MALAIGDEVLLRSSFRGRVRWCFPHHYVGEWDGRAGIYCQPGNVGKVMRRVDGGYLVAWLRGDPPRDLVWHSTHVLRFMRPGAMHTIELFWGLDWRFLGWYVNLQAPLVARAHRFDTTDWALDVVVDPDGTWHWKDEDELTEAIELGVFADADAAAAVRREGERVIAESPWPTGWERWRPATEWLPLPLPADWSVV